MTHWDGLSSSAQSGSSTPQRICILGATNRINDIDEAILRRMPKKFPVSLPSSQQRYRIFSLILKDTKVDRQNLDMDYLVRVSNGLSGSDIKEACRDAAMGPVREYIREQKRKGTLGRGVNPDEVRGIRTEDFFGRAGGNLAAAAAVAANKGMMNGGRLGGEGGGSQHVPRGGSGQVLPDAESIDGDEGDGYVTTEESEDEQEKRRRPSASSSRKR